MTLTQQARAQTGITGVVVAGLGLANWYQEPTEALVWFAGIATMGVIVAVVMVLSGRPTQSDAQKRFLALSAVLASALLAVPLGVALVRATGVSEAGWLDRAPGMAMGLVLLFVGNVLPKVFGRPAFTAGARNGQSARRLTGWAFALAGLGGLAVWTLLPIEQADIVSTLIYAGALIATLTSWAWFSRRSSRS